MLVARPNATNSRECERRPLGRASLAFWVVHRVTQACGSPMTRHFTRAASARLSEYSYSNTAGLRDASRTVLDPGGYPARSGLPRLPWSTKSNCNITRPGPFGIASLERRLATHNCRSQVTYSVYPSFMPTLRSPACRYGYDGRATNSPNSLMHCSRTETTRHVTQSALGSHREYSRVGPR